jgi:hypothetical protein
VIKTQVTSPNTPKNLSKKSEEIILTKEVIMTFLINKLEPLSQ